jgi:hypothetical protein
MIDRYLSDWRLGLVRDSFEELPPGRGIPRTCSYDGAWDGGGGWQAAVCLGIDTPISSPASTEFWGADRTISAASYDF